MHGSRGDTDVVPIEYGAIARVVAGHMSSGVSQARVREVLVRPNRTESVRGAVPRGVKVIGSIDEIGDPAPAIVVECGGHRAVREYGEAVLVKGSDLLEHPVRAPSAERPA